MSDLRVTRRSVLKSAALGSAAVITAPYVSCAYAAGNLTLGCWDHWVPGANNALTKLCNEWGEKNKVEVHIDYITSQGEKDKLTAAAEAQAGTGHDIMSHRDWNIRIHQNLLEPLDDVVEQLIKQNGPISPVAEYLAKIKGTWRGVPTTVGSQVKPCQSRLDLYKEHCGIDLVDMFPPTSRSTTRRKLTSGLGISISTARRNCIKRVILSACPWARLVTRSIGSEPSLNRKVSCSLMKRIRSRSILMRHAGR